jgi:hypothetical protein
VRQHGRGTSRLQRKDRRAWIVSLLLCLVGAVACAPATRGPVLVGCLGTPGSDLTATVGQPVRIEATVVLGGCAGFPTQPQDDNLFKHDISVGDAVRLRLLAPLLPVRIEPVSSEVQPLRAERPEAFWEWRVIADEPGMHRLSIVASVVDPDGGEVVIENREVELRLHAEGTVGYYAGRAWNGLMAFVMSAQVLVAGIAALASVLGGTWLARRRRARSRRALEVEPEGVAGRDRDPSGYL